MPRPLSLGSALLLAVCLSTPLWACSIPVFRYALERWQADPYVLTVYYRDQLDPAASSLAERLHAFESPDHSAPANVRLQPVNLADESDEALLDVWHSQATEQLPWMVVHHLDAARQTKQIWSSPFDASQVDLLLTSPQREELARRLLAGDSAVWLLLESGDAPRDEAAAELLTRRIDEMQDQLTLPELAAEDLEEGLMTLDPSQLKLSFSLLRVSRNDPAEAALVRMLLETEHDLQDFPDQPLAFPIFGRGRVLYALVGEGINEETIEVACRELIGPCTCQVKDQNPGCDLLMSVAWNQLVTQSPEEDHPLPTLPGLPDTTSPATTDAAQPDNTLVALNTTDSSHPIAALPPVTSSEAFPQREHNIVSNVVWTTAAAIVALVLASVVLVVRRNKSAGAR